MEQISGTNKNVHKQNFVNYKSSISNQWGKMIYVTNGVQTTDRHLAKTRKNKSESVLHNLHQNKSQLDQIFTWKK